MNLNCYMLPMAAQLCNIVLLLIYKSWNSRSHDVLTFKCSRKTHIIFPNIYKKCENSCLSCLSIVIIAKIYCFPHLIEKIFVFSPRIDRNLITEVMDECYLLSYSHGMFCLLLVSCGRFFFNCFLLLIYQCLCQFPK